MEPIKKCQEWNCNEMQLDVINGRLSSASKVLVEKKVNPLSIYENYFFTKYGIILMKIISNISNIIRSYLKKIENIRKR